MNIDIKSISIKNHLWQYSIEWPVRKVNSNLEKEKENVYDVNTIKRGWDVDSVNW